MHRKRAVPALLAAALLLPGCFFARRVIPADTGGMDYPVSHFAWMYRDQVARTGRMWSGAPAAFDRHVEECVRNLTTDPGTFHEKEFMRSIAGPAEAADPGAARYR